MSIDLARQFNVSKKTAKLNHAILEFQFRIEQIRFQKEILFRITDEMLFEASSRYICTIHSLNNECEGLFIEHSQENRSKFQNLFDSLANNYKISSKTISDNLESYIKTASLTIKSLNESIPTNILTKTEFKEKMNTLICCFKQNLENNVNDLKKNYETESEHLKHENDKRVQLFKANSREKSEQLRVDHAIAMDKLRKQAPKFEIPESYLKSLQNYKELVQNYKLQLFRLADDVVMLKSRFSLYFSQRKAFYQEIMKRVIVTNDHSAEISELQLRLKHDSNTYQILEENNLHDLNMKKNSFSSIIQRMNNEYQKQLNEYQHEISSIASSQAFLSSDLEIALKEIKDELSAEKSELLSNIDTEKKQITSRLDEISKNQIEYSKKAKSERKTLKRILSNEKKAHKSEIDAKTIDLKNELLKQQKIINDAEDSLRNSIKAIRSSSNAANSSHLKILESLKKEKQEKTNEKNNNLNIFDSYTNKIIENMKVQHQIEEFDVISRCNQEYKRILAENQEKIRIINENNKNAEKNFLKQKYNEYHSSINEIRSSASSNDDFSNSYKIQYTNLKNDLSKIQINDIKKEKEYARLNEKMERHEKMVNDYKNNITSERNLILRFYENQIQNETKNFVRPKTSGRARDQVKMSLVNKIETVRNEIENEVSLYSSKLEELEKSFIEKTSKLESQRISLEHNTLANKYESDLLESVNMIETMRTKSKAEIDEFNQRIIDEKEKIRRTIEQLNVAVNIKYTDVEELNANLMQTVKENSEAFEQMKNALKASIDNTLDRCGAESSTVQKRIDLIISKLTMSKYRSNDTFRRNEIEQNSLIREIMRRLEEESRRLLEQGQKRLNDLDERKLYLESQLKDLSTSFDVTQPRKCDLDKIQQLRETLKSKTNMIKILMKEFSQYKSLIEKQEKDFNSRFGLNLKALV